MECGRRDAILSAVDNILRPLVEPLDSAQSSLSTASKALLIRESLPEVREAGRRLQSLLERIRNQQASLLIFGPLKSGKSTLMNAITGAYVSEVTALPAYPCLVYVSYAPRSEFLVTRYSGDTESFGDTELLRERIEIAHRDLVARIREVEGRGIEFDPRLHAPDAILRVDVKVPAEGLRQADGLRDSRSEDSGPGESGLEDSGPVLVDTPGLYSRMRFAYDRMAREIRDTAACAVFVVKTDNLFLEQVFEEFDEILQLFSRIFLIVNIDSSKRDVSLDGSLVPSLEQRDPHKIIEAFRDLAMSPALRDAASEDRLRIYPVDLLAAASQRLREATIARGVEPVANGQESAGEDDYLLSGFSLFQRDLDEYLQSDDYNNAFLSDSLRYASRLVADLEGLGSHERVRDLVAEMVESQDRNADERQRADALGRLEGTDWQRVLARLVEPFTRGVESRENEIFRRAGDRGLDLVRGWFNGGGSLLSLFHEGVVAIIEQAQREIAATAREVIRGIWSSAGPGIALPPDIEEDLEQVGTRLSAIGRGCLDQLDPLLGVEPWTPPIPYDEIPIRGVRSWMMSRSQRQKLFGDPEDPSRAIPAAEKSRRLGTSAYETLLSAVDTCFSRALPDSLLSQTRATVADFIDCMESQLRERIEDELE